MPTSKMHLRNQTLATVRTFFLVPWIAELEAAGVDVTWVLGHHHLSGMRLAALYEEVLLLNSIALTEHAADLLDRPFLGLEIADKWRMTDFGAAYLVIAFARSLRAALSSLARCQRSWQTDTILDLVTTPDSVGMRYAIQSPAIWPRRQDAEFVMGTFAQLAWGRAGPAWRPLRVEFEHDLTGRQERLARWFGAPVIGNQPTNVIHFALEDIDRPLRPAIAEDQDVLPMVEKHLLELMAATPRPQPTWTAQTDYLIGKRLGRTPVNIEIVAAELHVSARSLRRHLADEGTTFRELLRDRRQATARAVLESEGTRIKELAWRLNYSDSATLSRAFKTWTGSAPSDVRSPKRGRIRAGTSDQAD